MILRVAVVDYGAGNLHSVLGGLAAAGSAAGVDCRAWTAESPAGLEAAHAVVLPGVGSFATAMARLHEQGLVRPLRRAGASGRPLLGICLGMHVLFARGREGGEHRGLGLLPGVVEPLPADERRPHMGWNLVRPLVRGDLLPRGERSFYAYFAHSYALDATKTPNVTADCSHGSARFAAVVRAGGVVGVQFHPERSGRRGLALLRGFVAQAARAPAGARSE